MKQEKTAIPVKGTQGEEQKWWSWQSGLVIGKELGCHAKEQNILQSPLATRNASGFFAEYQKNKNKQNKIKQNQKPNNQTNKKTEEKFRKELSYNLLFQRQFLRQMTEKHLAV